MGRTQTEIVGFAENVRTALQKVRKELNAAGYGADEIDAILGNAIRECAEANARQEALKRELKATTSEVEAQNLRIYRMASGYLDAAMGALGKGGDAAKNLQRIRSRIRQPADAAATTTQEPLPEGGK